MSTAKRYNIFMSTQISDQFQSKISMNPASILESMGLPSSNTPWLAQAACEIRNLHFEQGRNLLADHAGSIAELSKSDQFLYELLKARALRGLYQFTPSLQAALAARQLAATDRQTILAGIETAKAWLSLGKFEESQSVLETLLNQDPQCASAYLVLAALYAEQGKVDEAWQEIHRLSDLKGADTSLDIISRTDLLVLEADLESFAEHNREAEHLYQEAMNLCATIPTSWKDLREAMLRNNIGDLLEQEEKYNEAADQYLQGLKLLKLLEDRKVFDLAGYEMELYFSLANLYTMTDQFQKAAYWLSIIKDALQNHPPRQYAVFCCRYQYLSGLYWLYQSELDSSSAEANDEISWQDTLHQALTELCLAWLSMLQLAKQSLVKLDMSSKCTYYLAVALSSALNRLEQEHMDNSMPVSDEWLPIKQINAVCSQLSLPALCQDCSANEMRDTLFGLIQSLYIRSLDMFSRIAMKEPRFYLSSSAEIENELGILALDTRSSKAVFYFEQSAHDYKRYLSLFPQDDLAKISLLYVLYNLYCAQKASVSDQNDLQSEPFMNILSLLESSSSNPALQSSAYDLLLHILEKEQRTLKKDPSLHQRLQSLAKELEQRLYDA